MLNIMRCICTTKEHNEIKKRVYVGDGRTNSKKLISGAKTGHLKNTADIQTFRVSPQADSRDIPPSIILSMTILSTFNGGGSELITTVPSRSNVLSPPHNACINIMKGTIIVQASRSKLGLPHSIPLSVDPSH